MGKIDELIKELCPDGVKYVKLGEIAEIGTGSSNTNEGLEEGLYPFYTRGRTILRKNEYEFEEEAVITAGDGDVGKVIHYMKGKYALHQRAYRFKPNENLMCRFLFHYMLETFQIYICGNAVASSVVSLRKPKLIAYPIPLPPLSIQQQIVEILDTFTDSISNLQEELELREKQMEYYRENLLSFDQEEVKYVKLGKICEIYDGTHQTPKYVNEGIPFISVENIKNIYGSQKFISIDDYNSYKIKPQLGDMFMTRIGTIGTCAIVNKKENIAYYVSLALLRPNHSIVNVGYLKHLIESNIGVNEIRKHSLLHAVPIKINKNDICKIQIPLPPLSIQQQIVDILDTFESMIANIKEEIELRQKQYEYYREKLLTFERKEA